MALDAIWQHFAMVCNQVWSWVYYQTNTHPFIGLGVVVIIILAWSLHKMDVRVR